jgi:PAS domain S-box-containing protein
LQAFSRGFTTTIFFLRLVLRLALMSMTPEKNRAVDAARKERVQPANGVILLQADGKVGWNDQVAASLLGSEVRGLSWQELTRVFQPAGSEDGVEDSLGSIILEELQNPVTKKVCLAHEAGRTRLLGICVYPVREQETEKLSQLIITVTLVSEDSGKSGRGEVHPLALSSGASGAVPHICSTDLHRAVLLATQAGLLIFSTVGVVLDANREAAKFLETEYSGIVQSNLYDLLSESRVRLWRCAVKFAVQHKREKRFVETNGAHHYQIDLQPVTGSDGQIENVVAVMRDITVQWVCEIRYRELYKSMAKGVAICESPDGAGEKFIIKDMNGSGLEICNAQDEQVVGSELGTILKGVDDSGLVAAMRRVLATAEAEYCTTSLQKDDGKKSWLDTYLFSLPNKELVIVFEDISLKYDTEQALRKSRGEWENIFDALSDIITIQDKDLRIVRANRAAYRMFDKKFGELVGKQCYEVFQDFNGPCAGCPVSITCKDCCIHEGLVFNDKLNLTLDVRSSPIFEADGSLKWVVQVARDVSNYRKELVQQELLARAIEQISESIFIADLEGQLVYVNNAFCASTGYSKEELKGSGANILKSGAQDQAFYEEMWANLIAGNVWHGRMTNRKKDGTLFKEDVTLSPVVDDAGTITNYLALKRDVTREESLERELQQAMRMEAIGSLAGGLAHDFNNILSVIMGFSHIAKSRLEPNHPVQADIDQILAGGDRAVDLVKQVLIFSRGESRQQFRSLKVQYIIKEVVKRLHSTLPSHIELKENIDSTCGPIQADPGLIHQLLINLCTNATQAIGNKAGVITISLSQHVGREVRVLQKSGDTRPGRYLKLIVEDTGCGMDKKMLNRIFDPFFTTRSKEHGTGLGLAVVHGIVKKHRGEIYVESTVGKGTAFNIFFSVAEEELQPPEEDQFTDVSVGGNERIMVVDDEDVVAMVHEKILSKLGYRVSVYTDSMAALSAYKENPNCCDLVITDMSMPHITGTSLAGEMLRLRPELPIILVTGYSDEVDKEGALRIGIRDFLLKPVKTEVLSHAIRRVFKK